MILGLFPLSASAGRWLDVSIIFPGIPDLLGVCVGAHPGDSFVVEGCASTLIFTSSVWAMMKYQPLLGGGSEKSVSPGTHQWSFGPGIGVRRFDGICFDSCPIPQLFGDAVGSLEWVYWTSGKIGLRAQFDLGATVEISRLSGGTPATTSTAVQASLIPIGRLSFGLAF